MKKVLTTNKKGSEFFYYSELHDFSDHRNLPLEKERLGHARVRFQNYRARYVNRRCFVIGNGPSLNELDLTRLTNEVPIGSNGLYLNHDNMGFYQTFYTVTNSLIAERMGCKIAVVDGSIKIFPLFLQRYFHEANGEHIFLQAKSGFVFSKDVTKWISWQSIVTFFYLQIAFSLGCPEVFIIGVDNDYSQSSDNKKSTLIVQRGIDNNHFSPSYFHSGFMCTMRIKKHGEGLQNSPYHP